MMPRFALLRVSALILALLLAAGPARAENENLVGIWSYAYDVPGGGERGYARYSADGTLEQQAQAVMPLPEGPQIISYTAQGRWQLSGDQLTATLLSIQGAPLEINGHSVPLERVVPLNQPITGTLIWRGPDAIDLTIFGYTGRMERVSAAR